MSGAEDRATLGAACANQQMAVRKIEQQIMNPDFSIFFQIVKTALPSIAQSLPRWTVLGQNHFLVQNQAIA